MHWRTTFNGSDCGIFVMRHMETYVGRGIFLHELKKESVGQKVQLKLLRAKYLTKIILMDFNEEKAKVLKEAEEYVKKQPKAFKIIMDDNVKVSQEMFKTMNERVLKMLDY